MDDSMTDWPVIQEIRKLAGDQISVTRMLNRDNWFFAGFGRRHAVMGISNPGYDPLLVARRIYAELRGANG